MKRGAVICVLLWASGAGAAEVKQTSVAASDGAARGEWTARVDRMLRAGDLATRQTRDDTMLAGRRHERLSQLHQGVPVFGGELVVQSDAAQVLTVFGTLYEGIDLAVAPSLSAAAVERIVAEHGAAPFWGSQPQLAVLPTDAGYRLTYGLRAATTSGAFDIRQVFVDASTGEIVLDYSDLQRQTVGNATGVLNDAKKLSGSQSGSSFVADDRLRPPVIATYDFRGNVNRFVQLLNNGPNDLRPADLASDADNVWTDGANVDAHVYAGYTYDYYFKRHGRRGLDNANLPIRSVTHPIRREDYVLYTPQVVGAYFTNAAYLGFGIMLYGDGLPPGVTSGGLRWNYLAGSLDVVGHELTHGVTDFTSRLIYQGESGALNESFSDMMGTAIEFYFQTPGNGSLQADYLCGEDTVTPGGIRSMQNPIAYGDPDHYSVRYTGTQDNGGVHINSGIPNHAFYLAIEGGTNRISGLAVQGVGGANREQIERVFYRAFTTLLTPSSNFAAARVASIQAARELYGVGSSAERAVTQAWTAVGVN